MGDSQDEPRGTAERARRGLGAGNHGPRGRSSEVDQRPDGEPWKPSEGPGPRAASQVPFLEDVKHHLQCVSVTSYRSWK